MSQVSLNLRPDVKSYELMPLLQNGDEVLKMFYSFLISFLIATLIQWTKSSGNKFYSKLIRYIYNYKTGDFIGGINDDKAKEKLVNVIVHRKWDRLLMPDTLQSFFYIYKADPDNDIISQLMTQGQYLFIKISSIWTCASFIAWSPVAVILSTGLLLYTVLRPIKSIDGIKKLFCMSKESVIPLELINNKEIIQNHSYYGQKKPKQKTTHTDIIFSDILWQLAYNGSVLL